MPTNGEKVYDTIGKVRLSTEEKREIQQQAALNGMTFSDFVRLSVYGYMAEIVKANKDRYTDREYSDLLRRYLGVAENIKRGRHSHEPFRGRVVVK